MSATGTNFNATSGATTFYLNGVAASGGATSTTAATFTVPPSASSGRVSATTSIGTGTSTSDFIVPPPQLTAGDIESVIRIAANGGNSNIAVGTANKSGLVLFNGTANTYYSLQFRSLETTPISNNVAYRVVKPDNTDLRLETKRIPQYMSGGTGGSDAGHYDAIGHDQRGLADANRRVRRYCKELPTELHDWESTANRVVPKMQ